MDIPQYLWIQKVPWSLGVSDEIIQSIRRYIGDSNPNKYRISTQDMYYYLSDAVGAVESIYPMGYSVTVAPTSLTFNSTPTNLAKNLYRIKCTEIILTAVLMDTLFDGASINLGDIRINLSETVRNRREFIKSLQEDFDKLIKQIKMNYNCAGALVDTYVTNHYGGLEYDV
jgi:hypothetical protein